MLYFPLFGTTFPFRVAQSRRGKQASADTWVCWRGLMCFSQPGLGWGGVWGGSGGGEVRAGLEGGRCRGWVASVPPPAVLSVQRFLFYPDGGVDGETPPVLATQHVLAELGRVHAAAARGGHAETFLEEALENLRRDGAERSSVNEPSSSSPPVGGLGSAAVTVTSDFSATSG